MSIQHTRPADNTVRLSGALIGLVVFFAGIGLLYGVFQTARTLAESPAPRIVLPTPAPTPVSTPTVRNNATPAPDATPTPTVDTTSSAVSVISSSLIGFAEKWLLLLVMCIAGSLIASRGIELFFRACAAATHPPKPPTTPPSSTP